MIEQTLLIRILEAALLAAEEPLSVDRLQSLFGDGELGDEPRKALRSALDVLAEQLGGRGIELVQVASGFRLQASSEVSPWVGRLQDERPQRYSRALLETLAIIAYRQPVTRGDIEEIRGVATSTNIMRTLTEREWVRVVGHRDVPGRPAMYATSKAFLDYFGLKSLQALPPLAEIRDLDEIGRVLELDLGEAMSSGEGASPGDVQTPAPATAGGANSASNVVDLSERGRNGD